MITDFRVIQDTMFPKMTDDLAKDIANAWDGSRDAYETLGHHGLLWNDAEFSQFCFGYYLAWTKVYAEWCLNRMETK